MEDKNKKKTVNLDGLFLLNQILLLGSTKLINHLLTGHKKIPMNSKAGTNIF